MSRWMKAGLVVLLILGLAPATPAFAQANPACPIDGVQASGAKYCISVPPAGFWNGDLVIFAHGYVSVNDPLDIPWSQMTFSDGMGGTITLPTIVNGMGYAFATTSYSVNGLAVKEGIADVLDLINVFKARTGMPPVRIYLIGASEGGLVTTLSIERHPEAFTGGLALCGPIGSFRKQVNYWGDFRVVFDYFMDTPTLDMLPGTAVNIPQALMAKWNGVYSPRVATALGAKPLKTQQLISVTQAPFDPMDPLTVGQTTLGILWYNVFATNDAIAKLGGQPYDNRSRVYTGSFNDTLLNAGVKRFSAKPAALQEIAANYETSGVLTKPLVTMHTTGDPIVPAWHQTLYTNKVLSKNPLALNTLYLPMTFTAYGHCNFTLDQMITGFGALVTMSGGTPPVLPPMQPAAAGAYRFDQ